MLPEFPERLIVDEPPLQIVPGEAVDVPPTDVEFTLTITDAEAVHWLASVTVTV